MSANEIKFWESLIRSGLILTGIIAIPIGLLIGLLGPLVGLIAITGAIPASAHLGGVAPLGRDADAVLERIRREPERFLPLCVLSTLFGLNIYFLCAPFGAGIPLLSLLISSLFSIALYRLGLSEKNTNEIFLRLGPVCLIAFLAVVVAYL